MVSATVWRRFHAAIVSIGPDELLTSAVSLARCERSGALWCDQNGRHLLRRRGDQVRSVLSDVTHPGGNKLSFLRLQRPGDRGPAGGSDVVFC